MIDICNVRWNIEIVTFLRDYKIECFSINIFENYILKIWRCNKKVLLLVLFEAISFRDKSLPLTSHILYIINNL